MASQLWTQKSDIGPLPRTLAAMTYDSARKKMLLFGGFLPTNKLTGDTWEWDGNDWTQVADTGPLARGAAAMAFDAQRERAVLFGGNAMEPNRFRGDTWEWDGEFWTQVSDTGPDGCSGHQMVYDSDRKCIVLFGGVSIDVDHYVGAGKTWEWDGSVWVQQDDTGPSARHSHAMAYDSERHCVILFGGAAVRPFDFSGQLYGDTWERKQGVWKQERDFGPGPAKGAAIIFDGRRAILFGGYAQSNSGATWEWDGRLWTQKQDIGPMPRDSHAMGFDSDRQQVVVFGGYTSGSARMLGDTWELPRT